MGRLLSPDDKCLGVDVPYGRRHGSYNGTVIDVADPYHERLLRRAGYTAADASGAPVKAAGFYCEPCSFASFFRLCSRCGGTCDRPDIVA